MAAETCAGCGNLCWLRKLTSFRMPEQKSKPNNNHKHNSETMSEALFLTLMQ